MEYLPIQKYADVWNISKRRIQVLCKEGRIAGAKKIGNMWVIPESTERPSDARTKSPIAEPTKDEPHARRELKRLLKKMYDAVKSKGISVELQKEYVLSIIASELCSLYVGHSLSPNDRRTIYNDISGLDRLIEYNPEDIMEVSRFISEYKNDSELDNILSWAYQYSNKFIKDNDFSKTQFFTEKYMIDYLIRNISSFNTSKKILDPCVGGGNFLVECLEVLCKNQGNMTVNSIKKCCSKLYGYDIDKKIAKIALVNIKLKSLSILSKNGVVFDFSIWREIEPNIFFSSVDDSIQGSLSKDDNILICATGGKKILAQKLFSEADVVVTNPPFATIKGMDFEEKTFLKQEYPFSNCDTCVAFIEAIGRMLSNNGVCGIVSQCAWMYLKSFGAFREWVLKNYHIDRIANLGSGAFQDLNGEKSNVSLFVFRTNKSDTNYKVKILNAADIPYGEKVGCVTKNDTYFEKDITELNGVNGFDFSENDILKELQAKTEEYKELAVPMQGTSTGNAKELVGYFWEHFGDTNWISVSNGGGYSRWQGLNDSVVKWGKDGEYIKAQKGSALRNVKYFPETQMVFSDTGTAGLNVRLLHDNQIFIASGPGIRIKTGNEYAHLALLNSRVASYCIRLMSPKLTIAAGYIGQLPVTDDICSSVVLEKNARLCVELKEKMLSTRACNIEYSDSYLNRLPHDVDKAAWMLFNEDLTNELIKLEVESKIDSCIIDSFGFSEENISTLDDNVGKCAYEIAGADDIDLLKLDKYLDKLLDSNCCLKRTKNSKNALGSDGFLEYIAKDLEVNPEVIVSRIQETPQKMARVMHRYKNLLLHNYVLFIMGYNTRTGVKTERMTLNKISDVFASYFGAYEFKGWVENYFNEIHTESFKGKPFLLYNKGEIRLYDRVAAK